MNYIISFYNKINKNNRDGFIISSINSFLTFGNTNYDRLYLIIRKENYNEKYKKLTSKHPFISFILIEDLIQDFEKFVNKNIGGINKNSNNLFLGIFFSTWYGEYILRDSYVLIENDIFSIKDFSKKDIFDFNSEKIQLTHGRKTKEGKIKTNSMIFFTPLSKHKKINEIIIKILKENDFNTRMIWEKFDNHIDDDFELNSILEYWHNDNNLILIHRNNTYFQKEFNKFNPKTNEEFFIRAKEKGWLDKNLSQFEKFIEISKEYHLQLLKTAKKFNLKLPITKKQNKKKIKNFIKNLNNYKNNIKN